jgi:hypothetical protein
MNEFQIIPQKISTHWIENLALEEINMEESGVIKLHDHLDPRSLLEESSINLMEHLRQLFEIYLTRFNELRSSPQSSSCIKIFKISNTVNDFMLFRNSLKLIVSRKSSEVISIGFSSNATGSFGARLMNSPSRASEVHEIRASVGNFNKVSWLFQGEIFEIDSLVKHYLTEFIRNSSR